MRFSGFNIAILATAVLVIASAARPQAGGGWSSLSSMPTPRSQTAVGVVNGIVYAIGGSGAGGTLGTNERFNPATNIWTSGLAPLPTPRTMSGTNGAVVNGRIHVIGGNANGLCSSANEAYDPATNSWMTTSTFPALAPMPTPRCHLAVVATGGRIYAIGGTLTSGAFNYTIVEEYNPATNTWATKAPMFTPRSGPAAAVVNGIIYVMGGSNGGVELSSVEAYNPATDSWSFVASMPSPRSVLCAGALKGIIYAVGGFRGSVLDTVESFDAVGNVWRPQPASPSVRVGAQTAVVGCGLYVIGGGSAATVNGVVEFFRPNILAIDSPSGPGSARLSNEFFSPGSQGALYITALTINQPGGFPNGWFYGIAIPPAVLSFELSFGAPFIGFLNASGLSSFTQSNLVPPGLLLNAVTVAVSPLTLTVVGTSAPIAFTTL